LTDPLPELSIGDRSPNFVLPGLDGEFYSFHERVRGNRTLLFLSSGLDQKTDSIITALDSARRDFEALATDVLAVVSGTVEEVAVSAAAREATELPFQIFADVKGKILQGFREMLRDSTSTPISLVLDANQRVLMRIDVDNGAGEYVDSTIAYLKSVPQPSDRQVLGNSAPVLLIPNVIEPELCSALIHRWQTMGHEEGKVQSVLDGRDHERVAFEGKRRLDHYIQDQALTRELGLRVVRRLAPEIEKAYRFEGFRLDPFLIGCYQAERKDFFRPHRDNLSPTNADRMFALSINLNTEEYDGGDLRFPEYGPHLYRPSTGAALVFSCSLIHEALPVTRGRRFVLLNFMRDVRPPDAPRTGRPAGGV
tara:strand:- start:14366 stop:15463 length:1098 start_codon:yes stop_codon:yes gene_type:complete